MKQLLLALLLALSFASPARPSYPPRVPHTVLRPITADKVYICGGGSAYAYHTSETCAGLNRCTHGVKAVAVREAEGMGRRPCKKCH